MIEKKLKKIAELTVDVYEIVDRLGLDIKGVNEALHNEVIKEIERRKQ